MYHVYIIYNASHDKLYIGQTSDLNKRILEHNQGLSTFTSKYNGGWQLIHSESFSLRGEVISRENFLKRQRNRKFYWELIRGSNS